MAWVAVIQAERGKPAFALGPADTEAAVSEMKEAVRLPTGWTVTVVELRTPHRIDSRAQIKARRGQS